MGTYDLGPNVRRVLDGLNLTSGKVGLVGAGWMDAGSYVTLKRELPNVSFEDATDIIENQRMVKSEAEVHLIKKASQISDAAFQTFKSSIQEGKTESDVLSDIDAATRTIGAHNFRYL